MCRAPARLRFNSAPFNSARTQSASSAAITFGTIAYPSAMTECRNADSECKLILGRELKQSGNFQTGDAGHIAGKTLHLIGELFIHAPRSFVHRRAYKVLQHLLIFFRKDRWLDLHFEHLFLPVHL